MNNERDGEWKTLKEYRRRRGKKDEEVKKEEPKKGMERRLRMRWEGKRREGRKKGRGGMKKDEWMAYNKRERRKITKRWEENAGEKKKEGRMDDEWQEREGEGRKPRKKKRNK